MIRLDECSRRHDGLGRDDVVGYVRAADAKWARCVAEGELEPVDGEKAGGKP